MALLPLWCMCTLACLFVEFGRGGDVLVHEVRIFPNILSSANMDAVVSSMRSTVQASITSAM